jgi:Family of unknown function (DUF6644)
LNPADTIEGLAIAQAMRDTPLLYAAAEIAHTVGFTVLVGATLMFDLRVLGLSRQISVRALSRHLLPWSLGALFVIVPTGLMMFAAHAEDLLDNGPFKLKMALLFAAGMNAAMFRTGPYQTVKSWDTNATAPLLARASVALSMALWIGVISCGRLIAYF